MSKKSYRLCCSRQQVTILQFICEIKCVYGSEKEEDSEKILILHNEELREFHRSAGVVSVEKCRRLRWAGYVARMDIT